MCKYFKSNSLLRFVALQFCVDTHENDGAHSKGKMKYKNMFLVEKTSMVNCYGVDGLAKRKSGTQSRKKGVPIIWWE